MRIPRRRLLGGLACGAGVLTAGSASAAPYKTFPGHAGRLGLLHDTTLCIGCRSCEAACKKVNDLPPVDVPVGDKSVFSERRRTTPTSLTVVNRYDVNDKEIYRKHQCMHCNEPSCVSVCLVSALTKSPEGPVLYDPNVCMGCRYCMVACPYYALSYEYDDPLTPRVMRCTMCYPRIKKGLNPGCADACPMGAIVFGKRSDLLKLARDRIQKSPGRYIDHIFGQYEFGGTSWLTLAGVEFDEIGLLEGVTSTPLPELTKGFLSLVPLVLTMWPGLLLGFYAFSKRRDKLAARELEAAVADAIAKADEETKTKLAAAAKRAASDKEKAIAQAVKKALAEEAKKQAAEPKEGPK